MKRKVRLLSIPLLLCVILSSCIKKEKNIEPELTFKGNAAPPVSGHWRKMGEFFNARCTMRCLFTIGGKGYFIVSGSSKLTSAFWEYDPVTNAFTPRATLPGQTNEAESIPGPSAGFTIRGKGYITIGWYDYTGRSSSNGRNLWEYDPVAGSWNKKPYLFTDTLTALGQCTIGDLGYVCSWSRPDGYNAAKTFSYDPQTDQWVNQNALFSGNPYGVTNVVFAATGKAYMVHFTQFYDSLQTSEFDPATKTWARVSGFPVRFLPGYHPISVTYPCYALDGKGYLYCGTTYPDLNPSDNRILEFNPSTHEWHSKGDFDGPVRSGAMTFTIGSKAYLGCGNSYVDGSVYMDLWEYTP